MATESDGRGGLGCTLLLVAALAVGWFLTTTDNLATWGVRVRDVPREDEANFKAVHRGYANHHFAGPSGEGWWAPEGTDWVVFLPEPMSAMRSDWRLKLTFTDAAVARNTAGVQVVLNGQVIKDNVSASRRRIKLNIPARDLRPDANTLEFRSPEADTFRFLRVRNYYGLNDWFPYVAVIGRHGPYTRRVDGPAIAQLAVLLALGAAAAMGLGAWWRATTGTPVWTARQWASAIAPPVAVMLALGIWNLAGRQKVLWDPGSAVVVLLVYFGLAGLICAWRNLRAVRWPELAEADRERWLERRRLVVLFAAIWLAYNLNMERIGEVDGWPAPRMAMSLIQHGDFDLDECTDVHGKLPVFKSANGHWVSRWTPGSALCCVPFFLIPTWLGIQAPSTTVDCLAKVSASTLTALSAVFLFLCLRRFCSSRGATWLTIGYALGTASFSISAQDTWQHGPAQFCLTLALWLALAERPGWLRHVAIGAVLGLAVVCRPVAAVLVLPLYLWSAQRHGWRALLGQAIGGAPLALFLAAYNLHYLGTVGLSAYEGIPGCYFDLSEMPVGLPGILISPNRGMLVFSPFLIPLVYGFVVGLRHPDRRWRGLAFACLAGVFVHLLVTSAWKSWHAFLSYGSRYSADLLPFWVFLGGFGIDRLLSRVGWRRVFVVLVCLSIFIQSLGVFVDVHEWNWHMGKKGYKDYGEFGPAAWEIEQPQIIWQIRFALGLEKRLRDLPPD